MQNTGQPGSITAHKEEIVSDMQAIREYLGIDSYDIITDDRIALMLQITGRDVEEACKMCLGYIIQTLNLRNESNGMFDTQIENYTSLLAAI